MQNNEKMTEALANGYSSESTQCELSNEYQHDRVSVMWTKVAPALEGLSQLDDVEIIVVPGLQMMQACSTWVAVFVLLSLAQSGAGVCCIH